MVERKPRSTKSAKPAAKAELPDVAVAPEFSDASMPNVVTVSEPVVAETDLKKRELIDMVVERSGVKRKDVKPAVEAMLAILGETLSSGRELNMQPLGKMRINRVEEKGNGRVIVCKLRQSTVVVSGMSDDPENDPDDPLADAAE
jgi:DNA-binding protein HU-alpha